MLNKVLLIGRLVADPELKYTPSNVAVVAFKIAVDRSYQKQGEEKKTDFISCVAWRNTAEFVAKYFSKGQLINVVGVQDRTRPCREERLYPRRNRQHLARALRGQ